MTEERDGRLMSIGELAGRTMLRIALRMAQIESRGHDTHGVAGAGMDCGADTQGGNELRGMETFDGYEFTRRGGPDEAPQAPALISQTPARACRITLRQVEMSGCAKALDQREPSPNRSGRKASTAIPAPARVSKCLAHTHPRPLTKVEGLTSGGMLRRT